MENAVDALKMAAGILFSLLLTSLLILAFTQINQSEDTRANNEEVQKTVEFNNKFKAFDKSIMYGTDLISVLGLAISNNKICNYETMANPDGRYNENVNGSINIEFKLITDVKTKSTTEYYKRDNEGKMIIDTSKPSTSSDSTVIEKGKWISLVVKVVNGKDDEEDKKKLDVLDQIAINGQKSENRTEQYSNNKRELTITTVDTSGYGDLKKRIFKCTDVKYAQNGRIYSMSFEEQNIDSSTSP